MRLLNLKTVLVLFLVGFVGSSSTFAAEPHKSSLQDLGRFDGWRENYLIGQGIVVGLDGTGDSRRSQATKQMIQNVMGRLGTTISEDDITSRNVAIVTVQGELPASANVGDRVSVTVSSLGDARSLAGGTLIMTPLYGPNRIVYGLAQGPLITGGYTFESEANFQQRNFPTNARIQRGATIEREVNAKILSENNEIRYLLDEPNFTTSDRVAKTIQRRFGEDSAWSVSADEIRVKYNGTERQLSGFLAELENLNVSPSISARIVINERTGTIVAGGNVRLSPVVVSQGDIKVIVKAENFASQPAFISGFANDVSSLVVTNTDLDVRQGENDIVASFSNTSIADLVEALSKMGVDTRRIISILHAIKDAGALHAEIVVQ